MMAGGQLRKASGWGSHPRRVPLITVTMMEKKDTVNLSTEYPGRGGVNVSMVSMVTSSHFES